MQDPNEDTEWNDILRKHKIIPEKEKEISSNEVYDLLVEQRDKLEQETKFDGLSDDEIEDLLMNEEDSEAIYDQYSDHIEGRLRARGDGVQPRRGVRGGGASVRFGRGGVAAGFELLRNASGGVPRYEVCEH
ncbi:Viral IAP-associated factor-like protein [Smittium culicis]|uniref:Viral IAP-associated factor-like protein n=2 Tax=Smittium culicis TaxID=133412 RepID=A0A1R1XD09_9FUNG|nr:Viral IAP-associated factor-like protein [Smittium culicis]